MDSLKASESSVFGLFGKLSSMLTSAWTVPEVVGEGVGGNEVHETEARTTANCPAVQLLQLDPPVLF